MNSSNIFSHNEFIIREMCEKLNNHESIVVWLIGQSVTERIKNYTAIDYIFEILKNPKLIADIENKSVQESSNRILDFLKIKSFYINFK
jgi:adenylylsulfate kinase-like enzyme